jgi:hypothetical protein
MQFHHWCLQLAFLDKCKKEKKELSSISNEFFSYNYLIRANSTAGSVHDPVPAPVRGESSPDYTQQCYPSKGNQRAVLHRHNTERDRETHSCWLPQPPHNTTPHLLAQSRTLLLSSLRLQSHRVEESY